MLIPSKNPNAALGRVEALDLLRGFAVVVVLLFHYGFRGAAADGFTDFSLPDLIPFAKYGYFGVNLFFVISGFVIAYSAEGRTATSFAIARIARIYPGFLLCMTLTFLVSLAFGAPRFEVTGFQWLANLVIVAPALKQPFMDGAYWSIVYEITFYGWVFLLILAGLFKREIDTIIVGWIAISVLNETILHSGPVLRLFLTDKSAFFCAGLVLYEIFGGRRDLRIKLLLALAVLASLSQAFVSAVWLRENYHAEFSNVVIAGACLASIGAVALAMNVRRLPIPSNIVIAIGGLTYPFYLLHQHIGYILLNRFKTVASGPVLVVSIAIAMTLVSLLIWRIAERPAQAWLKCSLTGVVKRLRERWVPLQSPEPG